MLSIPRQLACFRYLESNHLIHIPRMMLAFDTSTAIIEYIYLDSNHRIPRKQSSNTTVCDRPSQECIVERGSEGRKRLCAWRSCADAKVAVSNIQPSFSLFIWVETCPLLTFATHFFIYLNFHVLFFCFPRN